MAVLHASPGTECWSGLHSALKQAVKDAPADAALVYAHRPVLPSACKVKHGQLPGTALKAAALVLATLEAAAQYGSARGVLVTPAYMHGLPHPAACSGG